MKKTIAIVYSVLAVLSIIAGVSAGYTSSAGPLNYIFAVILGIPWTLILGYFFSDLPTPITPIACVALNAAILWWWATRKKAT